MKSLYSMVLVVALGSFSFNAMAACSGNTQIKKADDLHTLLAGKTVCATHAGEKWQEYHSANGDLIDYKKGASDPVDPTSKVGNWSVRNSGANTEVVHSYGSDQYAYKVFKNTETSYSFCGAISVDITLVPGQVSCGM